MPEGLVDGVRIAYSVAGTGPPLVLLHGGIDDSRSWRQQLDGLADEFKVFASGRPMPAPCIPPDIGRWPIRWPRPTCAMSCPASRSDPAAV
jgi:pimeloyl-ACP methyl ester carboxylesterase